MAGHDDFLGLLAAERVVAIVRSPDAADARRATATLVEEGLALVEVSLTTPDAPAVIAGLRESLPDGARLGAGTVLTPDDARAALDAGADFVVTPGLTPGMGVAVDAGVPVLAGAFTVTEVLQALGEGATAVKLFPASLGGAGYLKAIRDPLPGVPFVPVGGVDPELARALLSTGAVAVGVGGPLLGDAVRGGDLTALRARVAAWRALAKEFPA